MSKPTSASLAAAAHTARREPAHGTSEVARERHRSDFERSLRRATGDDDTAADAPAIGLPPLGFIAAMPANPACVAPHAPSACVESAAAADASGTLPLECPPRTGAGRWHVDLGASGLSIRDLRVYRSPDGAMALAVSGTGFAVSALHRLHARLAARGVTVAELTVDEADSADQPADRRE